MFVYVGYFGIGFVLARRWRWPQSLRRGSSAAAFVGLRVRIPQGECLYASFEWCVLSGRGLCDGLITRPEEPYRVWCVWVWSRNLDNEEPLGFCARKKNINLKIMARKLIFEKYNRVYGVVSRTFWTDAVKITNLTTKCVCKLPTATQLHAVCYTDSLYMVVLTSTGASRYHNCCIDGPMKFKIHLQ
jgi:hypothetical protein